MRVARLGLASLVAMLLVITGSGVPARAVEPGLDVSVSVEARLAVSPILVGIELDTATAAVGSPVKARIRVTNASQATVRDVAVSLRVDTTAVVVKGGRATIGQIPAGRAASVGLTLCGRVPGSYLVLAQATLDGVTIESPAALLTILPGSGKRC